MAASIFRTSLKERTPTQVFSDEFCWVFKTTFHLFYGAPPGNCFCSTKEVLPRKLPWFYRKIFYQWNSKEPSEKSIYIKSSVLGKLSRMKNCSPALILTLTLSPTLNLTGERGGGGAIFLGGNFADTQVFISYSKISLIFSQLPMIYCKHEFSETMQSYYGKLLNDTDMKKLGLYWIKYKNSLKYKVGCFWRFHMFTQSIKFF